MYNKKQYVFDNEKPVKAEIRNYGKSDFLELIAIQKESFRPHSLQISGGMNSNWRTM